MVVRLLEEIFLPSPQYGHGVPEPCGLCGGWLRLEKDALGWVGVCVSCGAEAPVRTQLRTKDRSVKVVSNPVLAERWAWLFGGGLENGDPPLPVGALAPVMRERRLTKMPVKPERKRRVPPADEEDQLSLS